MSDRAIHLVVNSMPIAPGGGLTVLLGLLEQWGTDPDLRVTVLASKRATCDALRVAGWGPSLIEIRTGGALRSQFWEFLHLPRLLNTLAADVILTNNYFIARSPCPQVVHHQQLWALFARPIWPYVVAGPRRLMQTLKARHALRHAAANVFITDFLRKSAEAISPSCRDRGHRVYNGLSGLFVSEVPRGVQGQVDGKLVAVGGASTHKDMETALRALHLLRARRPDVPWTLRVCGDGDWTRLKLLARRLEVQDVTQFLGWCSSEALAREFRESECMLFPSVFESFGLPIIEAMACGCPVVAVGATAIPEVAGQAAALVPAHAPGRFADEVLRLREDPGVRGDLILRGRDRAREFCWSKSARAIRAIVLSVLRRGVS